MGQGMIVAPQPEAVEAGAIVLKRGGNAVDAAITCALVQGVVDPLMTGIAGFGSLQEFLETGYRRFHEIDEPGRFLDDLATRVGEVFERVYGEALENLEGDW